MHTKALTATLVVLALTGLASPASAHHHAQRHRHYAHQSTWPHFLRQPTWPKSTAFGPRWTRRTHYAQHRGHHYASSSLPAPCGQAAHLGGPCGCWASIHFFGHSVRELWLAANWLSFTHVSAAPGTAAVWPNRHHVAPVVGVEGNSVIVADSWGTHAVRMAGLTFVKP